MRRTDAEWADALRRYGWLRDDGDGERLHQTRPKVARNDEERCKSFYQGKCRYVAGHTGKHMEASLDLP